MSKSCRGVRGRYLKQFGIDGKEHEGWEVHHIIPRKLGGTNDWWNLILMDKESHKRCHMKPKQYREYEEEKERMEREARERGNDYVDDCKYDDEHYYDDVDLAPFYSDLVIEDEEN